MPSHDSEEFGGELYHDIIARVERSWGLWRDALGQVPDDSSSLSRLTVALIDETTTGDEAAVEGIRQLLEGDPVPGNQVEQASQDGPAVTSLSDARREMGRVHDRLLGAIEAASQASDDVLEQVCERIGGTTWRAYEDRVNRLHDHLHEQSS
jgi:hypothetical protein